MFKTLKMNQNLTLITNFRCGEVFVQTNQEFLIKCVLCNEEFYSFPIFTNHVINKICTSTRAPLIQQTLKVEKDIIDDLLVEPKIEPIEIDEDENKNDTQIIIHDNFMNTVKPKIEPIEIDEDEDDKSNPQITISMSNSINKLDNNGVGKELPTNSPTKLVKRTRIIKKKIIWDPDDPKVQLLCENYQNKTPKKKDIKKYKEIRIRQIPTEPIEPKKYIQQTKKPKQLLTNLETINMNNSKDMLVKTFQKQSRICNTPRKPEPTTKKKIQRIKKVIWDPDAPESVGLYKSKTNIDSRNIDGTILPHAI